MGLHFTKVALQLEVKIPKLSLARHAPASPEILAKELAAQIHTYASTHHLGYYPPLAYFKQQGGIDKDLLDATDHIAWLAAEIASNEVRVRLRPIFSQLEFTSVQTAAFGMPKVRFGQPNALHALAEHFSADVIRIGMNATLIQKQQDETSALRFTKGMLNQWLENRFQRMNVQNVRLVRD